MSFSSAIVAAIALAALAVVIIWANPKRAVNRAVFTCSLHGAAWLALLNMAVRVDDGLFWLRCTVAVGAFFPLHLWIVKEAIVDARPLRSLFGSRANLLWAGIPAVLATIAFTPFFIPFHSTPEARSYGPGYYIHIVGLLGMYGVLGVQMFREIAGLRGVKKMEMQIWLGGGIGACASVLVLMGVKTITENQALMVLRPILVICFFAVTTLAITTNRVFDAKHLLLITTKRLVLVVGGSAIAFVVYTLLSAVLPAGFSFLLAIGVTLHLAGRSEALLDRLFQQYPRAAEARARTLATAAREVRPDRLRSQFEGILSGWGQSEHAFIYAPEEESFRSGVSVIPSGSEVVATLRDLRWATPERLGRERESTGRLELGRFLVTQGIGAIVISEGAGFTIICAVGTRATRRPFTYPEVQQMLELSSIFQTALARSHLWHKAQRAEQLATVGLLGASVAHEIRNPLVTIKSFVHLLPLHYDNPDFRRRFFRLIGDEVSRMDRLVEQLLDLASPRHYNPAPMSLHQIIAGSLDLVANKAEERQVAIRTDFKAQPDTVWADPNATKQVLLNLSLNAIQAQEGTERERWIHLATRSVRQGVELSVADNGPGIPAEQRAHLFQAFHSTKSSGFGLGLAICSEIISSLDGTITVDPFVLGEGAVFRIVFPCPRPIS